MSKSLSSSLRSMCLSLFLVACNSEALLIPGDVTAGGATDGGVGADSSTEPAKPAQLTRIELDVANEDEAFTFDVPAGAVGIHISVRAGGVGDTVRINTLVDSIGQRWVRRFGVQEGIDEFALITPTSDLRDGMAALTLPSTMLTQSRVIPSGKWTGTLWSVRNENEAVPGPYHVVIAVQYSADGAFHRGVLDLDLFIPDGLSVSTPTPAHAITALDAADDAAVAARVDAFYAAASDLLGFERGVVRFHGIPSRYVEITDRASWDAVARETSVLDANTISARIVWTNQFSLDGNDVWGVSPGIPGMVADPGTGASAVILALASRAFPKGDGMTMLHELGHFVGLSHTSEAAVGFGLSDGFDDTPECTDETAPLQYCPDGSNLMFPLHWTGGAGAWSVTDIDKKVTLSDSQRRVFYAAPIYRGM